MEVGKERGKEKEKAREKEVERGREQSSPFLGLRCYELVIHLTHILFFLLGRSLPWRRI